MAARKHDQGKRARQLFCGLHDPLLQAALLYGLIGNQGGNDLAVACRRKIESAGFQMLSDFPRVDHISVVRRRDPSCQKFCYKRLDIANRIRAGRRVTDMADRQIALRHFLHDVPGKHFIDKPHIFMIQDRISFYYGDTGSFLPSVLQRKQPVIRDARRLIQMRADAEHSTFLMQLSAHRTSPLSLKSVFDTFSRRAQAALLPYTSCASAHNVLLYRKFTGISYAIKMRSDNKGEELPSLYFRTPLSNQLYTISTSHIL